MTSSSFPPPTRTDHNDRPPADFSLLLHRLQQHAQSTTLSEKRAVAFLAPAPNGGSIQDERTYAELDNETTALAQQLRVLLQRNAEEEEHELCCAVLVYPPSLDFMIAFLACLKAGIVAVPVFPPNPLRNESLSMFAKIVNTCKAKIALTNSNYNHQKKLGGIKEKFRLARSNKHTASWPEDLQWIVTDGKGSGSTRTKNETADVALSTTQGDRDRLAFLQFTSGSTSDPKGVMITHGNLGHNLSIITNELQAGTDTVVVSWLPQYHDMGLIGSYLGIIYCGGTGYYLSPLSFLQRPMLWIEAISKYHATHLQAPNFAFKLTARKFVESSSKLDLSSVRHVINAAEPVDVESMERFYQLFGKFGFGKVIYPTYGLAEHTVFVCSGGSQILVLDKKELEENGRVVEIDTSDSGDKTQLETSKMVGCGYPKRQGVDVKIVSTETSRVVEDDCVGEIWVQSPSKAAGYYQKPNETKEDFHAILDGATITENNDGYLRTGDLGFSHKDELFICGRLKDLIIVGGRNYYPQDLEATAEASSDALRPGCSAAFTIDPTHEGGEEVALVMELKEVPGNKQDVTGICDSLANKVRAAVNQEHSLGISTITFLRTRTVPKTSSGKIARAWCRKGFLAGSLQVVYQKSFKSDDSPLEIEGSNGASQPTSTAPRVQLDAATIRAMSKEEIMSMLVRDIARVGSIPQDSIEKNVPLIGMLDSITISQFKGMLENHYAVKISDEYLFRESTSVAKLVEVVKLGYAPDDEGGENAAAATEAVVPGQARGLAGALGCPPGVVCVIL